MHPARERQKICFTSWKKWNLCVLLAYLSLEQDIDLACQKTSSAVLGMSLLVRLTGQTILCWSFHIFFIDCSHTEFLYELCVCASAGLGTVGGPQPHLCLTAISKWVALGGRMRGPGKNTESPSSCCVSITSVRFSFSVEGNNWLIKYSARSHCFRTAWNICNNVSPPEL